MFNFSLFGRITYQNMFIKQILHHLNRRDTKLIPKFSGKLKATIFLVLIASAIIFTKFSFAQNLIKEKQAAISKGNNQESWLNEAFTSNLMSLQIMLSGTIPDSVLDGNLTSISSYKPGGIMGTTNKLISYTFNQPASGIEYIAQVKNNFLGKPAYAQGFGFNSLGNGILPLWKVFRNTVYSLFSIIFVVIGIMLMLRVKISPQAVITIQNSLPKTITALILVTFSYAIAGLCLDLMNFVLAFVLALIFKGTNHDLSANLFDFKITEWLADKMGLLSYTFDGLNNLNLYTFASLVQRMIPAAEVALLGGILGFIVGVLTGPVSSAVGFGSGALLITVVISLLLAFNICKFLFGLVKNYITVILSIIFAPFQIAIGAFPNSKMGFSAWLQQLIANLSVFPISILFLVIVNILVDYVGQDLWVPVILNSKVAGGSLGIDFFLPTMIGVGAIFLLPKLPSMIPEFIFMIKPSPWGKAIGEGVSGSFIGAAGRAIGKGTQESIAGGVSSFISGGKDSLTSRVTNAWKGSKLGKAVDNEKIAKQDAKNQETADSNTDLTQK